MEQDHEGLALPAKDLNELNKIEKAYVVSRFLLMLHEDDRFQLVQRPLEKLLEIIGENELFELLENINLREFVEVSEYLVGLDTPRLIKSIYRFEAEGVNELLKLKIEDVIRHARKKKKKKGHKR